MLDFLIYLGTIASIYAVMAISLNLQAGVAGLLNFGFVASFALGAYGTGLSAQHGLPWPVGVGLGIALSIGLNVVMGRLGGSLDAEYWAITTLALAELLRLFTLNETWLTQGAQGIGNIPAIGAGLTPPWQDLATLLLTAGLALVAYLFAERLTRARFGRVLRLAREQPEVAVSLGHNLVGLKIRMMWVSGGLAAVAGSVFTHYISYVSADELVIFQTFLIWTMVVLGGLGNHRGVMVGALLIQVIYSGTRFATDFWSFPPDSAASIRVLLIGLAMLLILLYRPAGVLPEPLRRIGASG